MQFSIIVSKLARHKNAAIRRWFLRCQDVNSYEKALSVLRKHIERKPARIYYDYGVTEALKHLGHRPGTVHERLQWRLQAWYKDRDHRFAQVATLVNKMAMRTKIEELGVPLPEVYFCDRDLSDLDVTRLPHSFVAKPHNGSDSKGVLAMNGGTDKLTGKEYDRNAPYFKEVLQQYVLEAAGTNSYSKVMIEEFVVDPLQPNLIPLDYKLHCYGGRVVFFQVINRNKGLRSQSFYTREWRRLKHIISSYDPGDSIPKPDCLDELLKYGDRIASAVQQMIRLDFYVTARGPIFGEFTTYPAAGRHFTEFGNAISIQAWEVYPDTPSLYY